VTVVSKTVEQDVMFDPGVLQTSYNGIIELTTMPWEVNVGSIILGVGTENVYDRD
jgi:hypothetical protein